MAHGTLWKKSGEKTEAAWTEELEIRQEDLLAVGTARKTCIWTDSGVKRGNNTFW